MKTIPTRVALLGSLAVVIGCSERPSMAFSWTITSTAETGIGSITRSTRAASRSSRPVRSWMAIPGWEGFPETRIQPIPTH